MIRLSLTVKWILIVLLTSLIGIAIVGFFAYWSTVTEFDRFLNETVEQEFIADVIQYYERESSWLGLNDYLFANREGFSELDAFRPPLYTVVDVDYVVLAGGGPFELEMPLPSEVIPDLIPLTSNDEIIGYALITRPPRGLSPPERDYLQNTNRALLVGILGASAVSILVGLLLSRQLLSPLVRLTQAITAMKSGDLHQHVVVNTKDELGQMAEAFNQMSAELHRANQLRQQMTADIAHDLRTPLHVMAGYIEAMRDGSLPPTPERFEAMNNEANLLKRLVDDLRTLSLADAKELTLIYQQVAPEELLQQIKDTFEARAEEQNVLIQIDSSGKLPDLHIDRERMIQALSNLVSNALRYTSSGGEISLSVRSSQNAVELIVRDSGSGIPADQLENIFERFYRVDESRHESQGESGLGLAIVKSIVEAHNGTIRATSQVGQGSTFTITLPAS